MLSRGRGREGEAEKGGRLGCHGDTSRLRCLRCAGECHFVAEREGRRWEGRVEKKRSFALSQSLNGKTKYIYLLATSSSGHRMGFFFPHRAHSTVCGCLLRLVDYVLDSKSALCDEMIIGGFIVHSMIYRPPVVWQTAAITAALPVHGLAFPSTILPLRSAHLSH